MHVGDCKKRSRLCGPAQRPPKPYYAPNQKHCLTLNPPQLLQQDYIKLAGGHKPQILKPKRVIPPTRKRQRDDDKNFGHTNLYNKSFIVRVGVAKVLFHMV